MCAAVHGHTWGSNLEPASNLGLFGFWFVCLLAFVFIFTKISVSVFCFLEASAWLFIGHQAYALLSADLGLLKSK